MNREKTAKREGTQFQTRIEQVRHVFHGKHISIRDIIFLLATIFCLTPWASPPLALLFGLITAQLIGHPLLHLNHKITSMLLQVAVVGLGFGINFESALKAGTDGVLFTVISIISTLLFGGVVGTLLKVEKNTAWLISSGTAICGGSAIAAISPVIGAKENQVSVALGTVFILNAVALFLFPEIGELLHLTQHQFGVWAAIAIHDTSSVVGAAGKYGPEALQIATTLKLARSLWIIPVALITSMLFKQKIHQVKVPWFIGLFIVAMLVHTYLPQLQPFTTNIAPAAKATLTAALFLIGSGLSRDILKNVGWKPLLQGIVTWMFIATATLLMVMKAA